MMVLWGAVEKWGEKSRRTLIVGYSYTCNNKYMMFVPWGSTRTFKKFTSIYRIIDLNEILLVWFIMVPYGGERYNGLSAKTKFYICKKYKNKKDFHFSLPGSYKNIRVRNIWIKFRIICRLLPLEPCKLRSVLFCNRPEKWGGLFRE